MAAGDQNAKHTHWSSRIFCLKGKELYEAFLASKRDYISASQPFPHDYDGT